MISFDNRSGPRGLRHLALTCALFACAILRPTLAATSYRAITSDPSATFPTVTLTGHDLTVDQLVSVARYGAAVEVAPEARRHQEDAHALLLEGAAEGVPIAGFDTEAAAAIAVSNADPTTPDVAALMRQRVLAKFEAGAPASGIPQIADEEVVRAMMTVRANTLIYAPASGPVMQMLVDFLNNRITPVVALPGAAIGPETALDGVAAAMVGSGDVYYHGIRVTARQAMDQAGLTPLAPVDADWEALTDTDAYDIARSALLLSDGRRALDWADLIFAMDLDGMKAGLAPLSLPAQANRPFKWLYWDAARVLDILKGSYLFDDETSIPDSTPSVAAPPRVYPANATLSPTRQGAAWLAWGALRDVTLIALNSSDQSPAFRVGLSPRESPELSTPQMMKYFVKGGRANGGKRGFIVPALNRDPYPMANEIALFNAAMGILDQAISQRTEAPIPSPSPLPDDGPTQIAKARQTVDATLSLLAIDITAAVKSMDARAAEDASRNFGVAPTAAWNAFRMAVPAQVPPDAALSAALQFLQGHQLSAFYPKVGPPPGSDDPIPLAQEKLRQ